ncbi:Ig-like domain-containing protein [Moritella viscosa]
MRKIIILCSLIILGCNDDSSTKSVEAKDILSIKITHENIAGSPTAKIASDSSLLFNAIAYYKNNSKMDITKEVNWVTSDPAVATVSNGISLSVTDANVSSLRAGFTSGYSGTLPKGRSYPTVAIATFSDMTRKYVVSDVSWVSSDPLVVSVNENGILKGISAGVAKVTANFKNEKSNTLEIKVTDAVITKIQVLPKENHLKSIPIGFTQSMVAVGVFSDGTKQSLLNGITWLSDDESIATVTNEGVVKGITNYNNSSI